MSGFIVAWVDENGVAPFGWNEDCAGAIECWCEGPIALFPDRAAARQAIAISTAFARLKKAQRLPANTDFLEGKANLQIIPLGDSSTQKAVGP